MTIKVENNNITNKKKGRPNKIETDVKSGKQKTIFDFYEDQKVMPISEIIIGKRKRSQENKEKVKELAESIREIGLMNPIIITRNKELVGGFHRILAFKELGLTEIPYTITTIEDPLKRELQEIDENLIRGDLVYLEEGEHLIERKNIYETMYPETKQGVNLKMYPRDSKGQITNNDKLSSPANKSFSKDISEKLNTSQRTIQRKMKIVGSIIQELRDAIRGTSISDKYVELNAISKKEPDRQKELADQIDRMKEKGLEINRLSYIELQLELFKKEIRFEQDQEIIQLKDRKINNAVKYLSDRILFLDFQAYQLIQNNGKIDWKKYKEFKDTSLWREGKDVKYALNDLEGIKQVEKEDSALHHENPYPWEHLFSKGYIIDKQFH